MIRLLNEHRFPKPKVGGSTPLWTASEIKDLKAVALFSGTDLAPLLRAFGDGMRKARRSGLFKLGQGRAVWPDTYSRDDQALRRSSISGIASRVARPQ